MKAVLRLLNEALDLFGEKLVVAALRSLIDDGPKAQLERNKEIAKRSYRRKKPAR